MTWDIKYSKRANDFIDEHNIRVKIREAIKDFIFKITGSNINFSLTLTLPALQCRFPRELLLTVQG